MKEEQSSTPIHFQEEKVNQLLKTSRGQLDGILKMYADKRYCVDISKQILSVISILQKANALILTDHIHSCVTEAVLNQNGTEKIDEIEEILLKYYI